MKVRSGWRTKLLLLLAFVAAGVIAWFQVEARMQRERAEPVSDEAAPPDGYVDVEIVAE